MPLGLSVLGRRLMTDPAGVRASLKVPALVWKAPPQGVPELDRWMLTNGGGAMTRPRAGEPLIFLVEKVPGRMNPFAMGVTLGRLESNDIVIDDGSVSRFHAWLQLDARTHSWSITDAESKNGTWVDGQRLAARQRMDLRDGAEVKVGDVVLRFLSPDALLAFVERASQGGLS